MRRKYSAGSGLIVQVFLAKAVDYRFSSPGVPGKHAVIKTARAGQPKLRETSSPEKVAEATRKWTWLNTSYSSERKKRLNHQPSSFVSLPVYINSANLLRRDG